MAPKTLEDFMRLPEGTLAEFIDGEILMSPSPKFQHQRVVSNLHFILRNFVEAGKRGIVMLSPFDVHLPSGDVVEPDLIFVAARHRKIIKDWIYGSPDLLIEVVSLDNSARDLRVKRRLYEENGVREYWVVDGRARRVEVLTLSGETYVSGGSFAGNAPVVSRVLPGLKLPAREIFR